jgi:hypothetical protein
MKRLHSLLASIFCALAVCACQGGGVQEPPPNHPAIERTPEAARPPADSREPASPPDVDTPSFAEPPTGFDEAPDPEEAAAPAPSTTTVEPPRAKAPPTLEYDLQRDDTAAPERSRDVPAPGKRAQPEANHGADAMATAPSVGGSGAARGRALEPRPRAPRPEPRPGLATHWGEQRYSPTREVSFVRARRSSPDALARLQYDDRAGAYAALPDGSWGRAELELYGGKVVARVVDGDSVVLPALRQAERVQIIGETGERYVLELENRTGSRFEIVATVDGLDVLDGKDGDPAKRGYLLAAYQTLTIDGFRDGRDTVAAFRFGNVGRSYAASKGKARNVGVIGIALFRERGARRFDDETVLRDTADPFPARYATPPAWR